MLKEGVTFIQPLALQAGIPLVLNNQLADAEILGDAAGLQQVILNLAINAFRHTPAKGSLTISGQVRFSPRSAVIEVADKGPGVATEDIGKIFEPGFSGDGNSAGLGLAVCKGIIDQHNGRILVNSIVGQGTTFSLEFPLL